MLALDEVTPVEGLDIAVGRDEAGHRVASEAHGLAGGTFTLRQAALRFAAAPLLTQRGRIEISPAPVSAFSSPNRQGGTTGANGRRHQDPHGLCNGAFSGQPGEQACAFPCPIACYSVVRTCRGCG